MAASRTHHLTALLRRELEAPGEPAAFAAEVAQAASLGDEADRRLLGELLAARRELDRAAWFVEAEPLWMRKLTWRLARPLLAVGLVAAVGFSFQGWVDPTLGVALFLLGAGSFFAAVQLFAPLWERTDRRRLERVERRYRERLETLLAEAGERRDR